MNQINLPPNAINVKSRYGRVGDVDDVEFSFLCGLINAGLEVAGCVHHPVEEVDQVNIAHLVSFPGDAPPAGRGMIHGYFKIGVEGQTFVFGESTSKDGRPEQLIV